MIVKDKTALISLIIGCKPIYKLYTNTNILLYGKQCNDLGWVWYKHMLSELNEKQLGILYKLCIEHNDE